MKLMKKGFFSILVIAILLVFSISVPNNRFSLFTTVQGKNGFSEKPSKKNGYNPDKKTKGKKKKRAPKSNDYGWADDKGRVWVPDGKMHGGKGWTRVYKDGSHDHVYTNGKVRVHKAKGKKNLAQRNYAAMIAAGILIGITIISPLPGDEVFALTAAKIAFG